MKQLKQENEISLQNQNPPLRQGHFLWHVTYFIVDLSRLVASTGVHLTDTNSAMDCLLPNNYAVYHMFQN